MQTFYGKYDSGVFRLKPALSTIGEAFVNTSRLSSRRLDGVLTELYSTAGGCHAVDPKLQE